MQVRSCFPRASKQQLRYRILNREENNGNCFPVVRMQVVCTCLYCALRVGWLTISQPTTLNLLVSQPRIALHKVVQTNCLWHRVWQAISRAIPFFQEQRDYCKPTNTLALRPALHTRTHKLSQGHRTQAFTTIKNYVPNKISLLLIRKKTLQENCWSKARLRRVEQVLGFIGTA